MDRNDVKVQIRRESPVQAQFLAAEMGALFERGIVEKAEIDRLLDLVHVFASQQHPGDVGFHQSEIDDRMVIQRRILQGFQQCLAHGISLLGLNTCIMRVGQAQANLG